MYIEFVYNFSFAICSTCSFRSRLYTIWSVKLQSLIFMKIVIFIILVSFSLFGERVTCLWYDSNIVDCRNAKLSLKRPLSLHLYHQDASTGADKTVPKQNRPHIPIFFFLPHYRLSFKTTLNLCWSFNLLAFSILMFVSRMFLLFCVKWYWSIHNFTVLD